MPDAAQLRVQCIALREELQDHFNKLRSEAVPQRLLDFLSDFMGLADRIMLRLYVLETDERPGPDEIPTERKKLSGQFSAETVKSILDEGKKL